MGDTHNNPILALEDWGSTKSGLKTSLACLATPASESWKGIKAEASSLSGLDEVTVKINQAIIGMSELAQQLPARYQAWPTEFHPQASLVEGEYRLPTATGSLTYRQTLKHTSKCNKIKNNVDKLFSIFIPVTLVCITLVSEALCFRESKYLARLADLIGFHLSISVQRSFKMDLCVWAQVLECFVCMVQIRKQLQESVLWFGC